MIARLLDRFRGHAVLGALFSLGVKVGGSVSALAMFALAAWTLDVAAFGDLVIVFNIVSLAAVGAVLGQDTLIQRSWGEYVERDPGLARGAVEFGLVVTLCGAGLAVAAFVLWAGLVDGRLTQAEIVAVAAYLASQTLLHYAANLTRVVRGAFASEPPRELFWRVPLVAVLAVTAASGGRASITVFFAVAAAAQILTVVHLAHRLAAALPPAVRRARPVHRRDEWIRRSATMTVAALAEAAHQYADVILIGHVLGARSAASYFVVVRIANVFSMLTSGIHNYSASKVSRLWYLERFDDLRRLMAQISGLTLSAVAALLAAIVFAGPFLLGIFGADYRGLERDLVAMSAVTSLATLAGPGPMFMLFMGADLLYLKLVLAALAVRVAALAILAPIFEVPGAIAAVAMATLPLTLVVTVFCIRRFGVDPSVGSIVTAGILARRRPGGPAPAERRTDPASSAGTAASAVAPVSHRREEPRR